MLLEFLSKNIDISTVFHHNGSFVVNGNSELIFDLNNQYGSLQVGVAICNNAIDDSIVTFLIYADDKLVDCVSDVKKKDNVYYININLYKCKTLKLKTETKNLYNISSAIWVSPQVYKDSNSVVKCPLNNIECFLSEIPIVAEKCICMILTNNYIKYFDNMLSSLFAYGNYDDCEIVAFGFDLDLNNEMKKIIEKYKVHLIPCKFLDNVQGTAYKTIIYSIGKIVNAKKYLYLDTDILIFDDIYNLFNILDDINPNSLLAVKHSDKASNYTFAEAILNPLNYNGKKEDLDSLGLSQKEQCFTSIINSGMFVASDRVMLSINHAINTFMPSIKKWHNDYKCSMVREEAVLIAALARLNCCVLLDEIYNIQCHFYWENNLNRIAIEDKQALFDGKKVKILHFTGNSKISYYDETVESL
jgi:hypothetical protein